MDTLEEITFKSKVALHWLDQDRASRKFDHRRTKKGRYSRQSTEKNHGKTILEFVSDNHVK